MKSKTARLTVPVLVLITCVLLVVSQAAAKAGKLVLHLPFEDGTGSVTATDVSGNGHDGTLFNMDPNSDWVSGRAGLALDFDGGNDYVDISDHAALDFGTGDFSVSYWFFKRSTTASWDNLYGVSKWSTAASPGINEWHLSVGSGIDTDNPSFAVEILNAKYKITAPAEITLHEWHHVVGVREGSAISLYVDGVYVAADGSLPPGGAINDNGLNVRIAANQPVAPIYYTNALFDDLQIYDFALDDGGVGVGDTAGGDIAFLFAHPGLAAKIFADGFESGGTTAWSSTVE